MMDAATASTSPPARAVVAHAAPPHRRPHQLGSGTPRTRREAAPPAHASLRHVVLTIDRSTIGISDVARLSRPGIAWCVRGVLEEMADNSRCPTSWPSSARRLASEGLDAVCKFDARSYPAFLALPASTSVRPSTRYRGLALREPRGGRCDES